MTQYRTYLRQFALTIGANGILAVLAICTGILSARILGVEGRGELAAIQGWPLFISLVSMMGLQEAVIYLGAKDRNGLGTYTFSAVAFIVSIGIPSFLLFWFLLPRILPNQPGSVVEAGRFYLLFIFINAFNGAAFYAARALQRVLLWNILRIVPPFLWLLVLLWGLKEGDANAGVLTNRYLAATGFFSIGCVYVTYRAFRSSSRMDPSLLRPMLAYGTPLMLSSIPQHLNLRGDQLMMASFMGSETLGVYAVAATLALAPMPLAYALAAVLFPQVSALSDLQEKRRLVVSVLAWASLMLAVGCLGLILIAPTAVRILFGLEFVGAVLPARILLAAAFFSGMNLIFEEGFKGMGEPREVLSAELIGLAVTAVLLALLLGRFQAVGAAIASLGAYAVVFLSLALRFRKRFPAMDPR